MLNRMIFRCVAVTLWAKARVKNISTRAFRTVPKPLQPRDPDSSEHITHTARQYISSPCLSVLRRCPLISAMTDRPLAPGTLQRHYITMRSQPSLLRVAETTHVSHTQYPSHLWRLRSVAVAATVLAASSTSGSAATGSTPPSAPSSLASVVQRFTLNQAGGTSSPGYWSWRVRSNTYLVATSCGNPMRGGMGTGRTTDLRAVASARRLRNMR
jgi:hypothetical protein